MFLYEYFAYKLKEHWKARWIYLTLIVYNDLEQGTIKEAPRRRHGLIWEVTQLTALLSLWRLFSAGTVSSQPAPLTNQCGTRWNCFAHTIRIVLCPPSLSSLILFFSNHFRKNSTDLKL